MLRLWRNSATVSKLNSALASLLRGIWLIMGRGKATRMAIVVFLLILTVVPIVLVTTGFDVEKLATYGYAGVLIATFLSSTTILFPAPGVVVEVVTAALLNPALVAPLAAVGGSLGEFTGYLAGYGGRAAIGERYGERYRKADSWMKRHGSLTLFFLAFLPVVPFDLAGIAAGALRFPYWKFQLACFAGRLPRAFIECYLAWWILPRFLH